VSDKFPAALVALPFALSGIFLYVMQLFTERAARIGMRRFLEKYIRSSSSYWFVNKEDCLNKAVNQRRPSVIISTGLYTAGYLGSCWIAIDAARQLDVSPFHDSLPEVVLGALVAVTIALLVTYIELARADRVAFSFMENYDPNSNQAALAGRG
jgi:hypothetical protein